MDKESIRKEFNDFDEKLLERYYQNQCSPEERQVVEGWFTRLKYNKDINRIARKEWDATSEEGSQKGKLNEILYKIHYYLRLEEYRKKRGATRRVWLKKAIVSVSAAIIIVLIGFWFGGHNLTGDKELYTEIRAPYGSRIKFDLPDGSHGWLNSGSSLRFPLKFAGRQRKVFLDGECYFNVRHNRNKPFIVETKKIRVVALGTVFDVQAYNNAVSTEEVTLVNGQVMVNRKLPGGAYKNIISLKPGEHINLNTHTGKIRLTDQTTDKYTSWKDGKLIFRNDPLSRVITTLEKYYNVNIEVKDKQLYRYHFHATFEDETLFEALRLLKLSSAIDYKICKRKKNADRTYSKRKVILSLRK